MTALAAQARVETLLTLRRGESVLLSLGIPVLLLGFFSTVEVLPTGPGDAVEFLAPGVLALAVMSTAMVGLGIATAFERQYGVLKRLGSTPLGRPALVAAKVVAVLAVEAVQAIVLVAVALLLGWQPSGGVGAVVQAALAGALATLAFAGVGLAMAGRLRAEMVLAAANGLYLVLLLLGGMVVPVDRLPEALAVVARLLPAAALSEVLRAAFSAGSAPSETWVVLAAWALMAPLVASLTFRWD